MPETDIRRMSKEEIDEMNERARVYKDTCWKNLPKIEEEQDLTHENHS